MNIYVVPQTNYGKNMSKYFIESLLSPQEKEKKKKDCIKIHLKVFVACCKILS